MKRKVTYSLDEETIRRFEKIIRYRHCTRSQCLTNWIWTTKLPEEEIAGIRTRDAETDMQDRMKPG